MENLIIVTTAFDKREEAMEMARTLLEKRLVACAQISKEVESMYWWKDELVISDEYVATLKTTKQLYKQVENHIKESHSYETPEIIGILATDVDSDYDKWLCNETCLKEKKK